MDSPDRTRDDPAPGLVQPSPWAAARAAHARTPRRAPAWLTPGRMVGLALVVVGLTGLAATLAVPGKARAALHETASVAAQPVLAHDGALVAPQWVVRWRITDAAPVADPEAIVRLAATAAVAAEIARTDALAAPSRLAPALGPLAAHRLQAMLDALHAGIAVDGLAVTRLDPPAPLAPALAALARARAAADAEREAARGWSRQFVARAEGEAGAFDRIHAQYLRAPAITRRQMYYATMERVLQQGHTVILAAPNARLRLTDPGARHDGR